MSDVPPFKVGDRVRVRPDYPSRHLLKWGYATVQWIRRENVWRFDGRWPSPKLDIGGRYAVGVLGDGRKRPTKYYLDRLDPGSWPVELVPPDDMGLDDVCRALVTAYQRGDNTAALALADRVMELLGGTARENAAPPGAPAGNPTG